MVSSGSDSLNAICPYFTMFPLDFPMRILSARAGSSDRVLDPFCGRGTTNYAARLLGMDSLGVDSSPVATAITSAKLVSASPAEIVSAAEMILTRKQRVSVPEGEFWAWAYHPDTLLDLCRLRDSLLTDCTSAPRVALRGLILGALHGPLTKGAPSYFSNQCPRTYAPKPRYATTYWKRLGNLPRVVDSLDLISRRAHRYYGHTPKALGRVAAGDSRNERTFSQVRGRFNWVITSPPYYGMRTYISDQWLRNWFVGGPAEVDYRATYQVSHYSPEQFAADLNAVWRNAARCSVDEAKMVIRMGGISDRKADPRAIAKSSLMDSGWRVQTIKSAGTALAGKRQADTFLPEHSTPVVEYDIWAVRE